MTVFRTWHFAMVLGAMLMTATTAKAEPTRTALVIGNANYARLPPLSTCARSANSIAAALRTLGFDVIRRDDASTGAFDAGIGELSQRLAGGERPAFVYVCGYYMTLNNRGFILPVTADVTRETDVITQGVLAKALLDAPLRSGKGPAVIALDLFPRPGTPPGTLDLKSSAELSDKAGIVAVVNQAAADAPTPLAAAITANLAGPEVKTDALMSKIRAGLEAAKLTPSTFVEPARSGFLAGEPAPPPPAPVPVVVAPPPPPPPAPPAPAAEAQPAPAAAANQAPADVLPDEAQMSEFERRKVQLALTRLGYYAAPVDSVFGPETRAAIRRLQHELGAEMTGRLTSAQATRLVNGR